jgi:hypothetical protein
MDGFEAGEQFTRDLINKTIVSRRKEKTHHQLSQGFKRIPDQFPRRLYVSGLRARPWN